jgi:hypothetical protein
LSQFNFSQFQAIEGAFPEGWRIFRVLVIISKVFFFMTPLPFLIPPNLLLADIWKMMPSCWTGPAKNSGCCPDLFPLFLLASKGRMSPWRAHSVGSSSSSSPDTALVFFSLPHPCIFKNQRHIKALHITVAF